MECILWSVQGVQGLCVSVECVCVACGVRSVKSAVWCGGEHLFGARAPHCLPHEKRQKSVEIIGTRWLPFLRIFACQVPVLDI